MENKKLIFWLANTATISSSEDSENWSDTIVCESSEPLTSLNDEDDDDTLFFPLMQYLIRLRRRRVDDYLHIIDSWSDLEFKNRLSLSRKTAFRLIGKFCINVKNYRNDIYGYQ